MATVRFSVEGNVATVTLDRPEAMNAIDPETEIELRDVLARIDADGGIRAVVLTGSGEKAFCSGADLKKTMAISESYAAKAFGAGDESFVSSFSTDKPVICAINGYALGGGLELALACDIRIAAAHARFGLPEVKVGTIPGAGGTQRLPRTIGASDAMLMLLTGDMIDAAEALRLGLISRVVSAGELLKEAQALAGRIAANAPLSVRAIKRLVTDGRALPLNEAIRLERLVWGLLRDTEDRLEGRRAFQEKRPPNYVGR
ncbi:enoyl-CoA hydratase/isomerase family protein [Mesorhizobium sp. NPDC059054]|uniref:enoyl-CoA hydratase/isomerase family protein n=1 Tax=Mesorhizobium sp. NPDC059054 TaxID=3346711 RepID=UPI00367A530B